jgi:hypothetical protein
MPLFPLMAKTVEGLPKNGPSSEHKMENQNEKQLLGKFTKGYRANMNYTGMYAHQPSG